MRSPNYYLTRAAVRGLFWLTLAGLIVWISGAWWWVGIGSPNADFIGWCIGSMAECVAI